MRARIDPQRLARKRIEAGLSQKDLGDKAEVSKQHVSMVEGGKANFSPRNMKKVADVLNCSIADLLVDEQQPASPENAA